MLLQVQWHFVAASADRQHYAVLPSMLFVQLSAKFGEKKGSIRKQTLLVKRSKQQHYIKGKHANKTYCKQPSAKIAALQQRHLLAVVAHCSSTHKFSADFFG